MDQSPRPGVARPFRQARCGRYGTEVRLLWNAVVLSSARIAMLAAAVGLNVLTARALGPAGRGAYALPAIDASLASTFLLGLQTATAFFMLHRGAAGALTRPALRTAVAFATLGALVATTIAWLNGHPWAAIPALLYLPCSAASSIASGYWIGRDRMKTCGLQSVAATVTTLACVALALTFDRTPGAAIVGWLVGQGTVATVALAFVTRDVRSSGARVGTREFARYAARAGGLNMVTLLSYRIDVFVVAALAPLDVLGLYTVAVAGAESTLAVTYAVNAASAPRIGTSDRPTAAAFAARCTRNTFFGATVVALAIALAAPLAVHVLFGARFAAMIPALRMLLVGVVALSSGGVITNYFMLNRDLARVPLATWGTSAAISGALSLALVPHFGMLGAAFAVTSGYVVGGIAAVVAFSRDSGIAPRHLIVIERSDLAFYRRVVASAWTRVRPAIGS